jgi:hypothetical protein
MRRSVLLIIASAFALAGCHGSGPVEASATYPEFSGGVRNDSTQPADPPGGATVNGGIMMGSGT